LNLLLRREWHSLKWAPIRVVYTLLLPNTSAQTSFPPSGRAFLCLFIHFLSRSVAANTTADFYYTENKYLFPSERDNLSNPFSLYISYLSAAQSGIHQAAHTRACTCNFDEEETLI
jgi:hypothetical protein